jgi:hypothetical protein
VFEYRVLKKMFGRKRDELTGKWRRLHKEKLYKLYFSPNIIRVIKSRTMRLAEHVACMVNRKGAYRVLVCRPDRKRPLGRFKRR